MMSYAQWGNALYSGEKSYRIVPKRRIFVRAAHSNSPVVRNSL